MNITHENIHLATAQQVFDQAVLRTLEQGVAAVDSEGGCMYRVPRDGQVLCCAVGHLVSNHDLKEVPNGANYKGGSVSLSTYLPNLTWHGRLIGNLQSVHDVEPVENWPLGFRGVARQHRLSTEVIDQWEAKRSASCQ